VRTHAHVAIGAAGAALVSESGLAVLAAAGFAVLPDLPFGAGFLQQAFAKRLRGMTRGDLFRSWMLIRAAWLLHSLLGLAAALVISWSIGPRWLFEAVLMGWGSHLAADALTHVRRPYPFFYPLSTWRFRGVASYFEKDHHAGAVRAVEWVAVAGCALWLAWWLSDRWL
jgi:hypothetical protein